MRIAPIAVFGLLARQLASTGLGALVGLAAYIGTFADGKRVEGSPLVEGARISVGPDAERCFGRARPRDLAEGAAPIDNPLTSRELEVARLVARGLRNQEIVESLGIKTRTVSSHLDSIYLRLKVSSRVVLTRWLIRAGLEVVT